MQTVAAGSATGNKHISHSRSTPAIVQMGSHRRGRQSNEERWAIKGGDWGLWGQRCCICLCYSGMTVKLEKMDAVGRKQGIPYLCAFPMSKPSSVFSLSTSSLCKFRQTLNVFTISLAFNTTEEEILIACVRKNHLSEVPSLLRLTIITLSFLIRE